MASASEFRLASTATAIAIILPKGSQSNVNALRSVHDKAYRKWEPHINILYPFVEAARLSLAVEAIKSTLNAQELENLKISIDAVDVFRHRKNATVFLKPGLESEGKLGRLRGVLTSALGCDESEGTHDGEFRPHLTMGQASLIGPTLQRLVEKVEKLKGLEWDVKSLAVLRRETSGEMKLVEEIMLSNESEEGDVEDESAQKESGDNWSPSYCIPEIDQAKSSTLNPIAGHDSQDISITSYNLMVEPRAPPLSVRVPQLLENLASTSLKVASALDVLCLQEVNEEILKWLLNDPTLQNRYPYCTHGPLSILPSHRNLVTMASRPFTSFQLQFEERHKSSLLAYFADMNVTVANIHLSSALTDASVGVKKRQMSTLTKFLDDDHRLRNSQIVIAGDFNLTTSTHTIETALSRDIISSSTADLVREVVDPSMWDDAYLMLKDSTDELEDDGYDGEQGATFDRLHNPLAAMFESPIDNRPQRYDRVLVRAGSKVSVESFDRFGLPNQLGECASDHYGVSAHLRIRSGDEVRSGLESATEALLIQHEKIQLVTDSTDLEPLIASYLPSTSDKKQREDALVLLRQTLNGNENLGDILLAPLGSYAMETYFKDSDVDVLAIGSIPPREFFDLAIIELRTLQRQGDDDGFKAVHYVNSLVPIVELVVQGIKIDLQYCQAVELLSVYHSSSSQTSLKDLVLDKELISMLPPASLRPLNTYRDTSYLLTTIKDMSSYRTAHRFLSLYLKRRGLYSAKFGYLGGIHLSLMLNRVVKLLAATEAPIGKGKAKLEHAHLSSNPAPASIVRTFFEYYANFDWTHEIVSDPLLSASTTKPSRSIREPVFIQSIHTPTARLNVSSSCTLLSAQTFASEFTRAKEMVERSEWDWCLRTKEECAVNFMNSFGAYVCITLDFWDIEDIGNDRVREMTGGLESKITSLMVTLGKIEGLKGRVWPARFRQSPKPDLEDGEGGMDLRGYYLVGISANEELDSDEKKLVTGKVLNAVRTFERMARELRGFSEGNVWVEVELMPKNKISAMDLVLDNRDWGSSIFTTEEQEAAAAAAPATASAETDSVEGETPQTSASKSRQKPAPKGQSRKLRPAQEVMSRIRWDPTLSAEDFLVGYEDRFLGVKEIELSRWKSEQTDLEFIPMHRIVWLRKKGDEGGIVWDREKRLDKICGSGIVQK